MGSSDNLQSNGNDFARAFELGYAPVVHGVFATAVELKVFDIIAQSGPNAKLSAFEIASKLPKQTEETPQLLDRMLQLLASQAILDCSFAESDNSRSYGLNSLSRYFTADESGINLAPTVLWGHAIRESCYSLKDAVLEGGIPFNKANNGLNMFDILGKSPDLNEIFNQAMRNRSALIMREVLQVYKGFNDDNVKNLLDVGGGFGSTINAVISKYPHIHGINFDLPHVVRNAPAYPGVEHIEGDMFKQVPKADAIILKYILHDWSDESSLKLLENCWEALPKGGKVIVIEMILPEVPTTEIESRNAFTGDILMHCLTAGGKERTQKMFENLAKQAGFSSTKIVSRFHQYGVIEFYKN
jgi:caffeic acid 3-O-methyltransferase